MWGQVYLCKRETGPRRGNYMVPSGAGGEGFGCAEVVHVFDSLPRALGSGHPLCDGAGGLGPMWCG